MVMSELPPWYDPIDVRVIPSRVLAVSSFIFAHSQEPLDHTSSTPNGITLEFPVTACENIDSIPHQDAGRNVIQWRTDSGSEYKDGKGEGEKPWPKHEHSQYLQSQCDDVTGRVVTPPMVETGKHPSTFPENGNHVSNVLYFLWER